MKFGGFKECIKIDDDSSISMEKILEEDDKYRLANLTPNSLRRELEEILKKNQDKLSDLSVYFTLLKGFVATGCLYLPKSFINGGWGFQIITMILSGMLTMYCSILLLDTRTVSKVGSYSEMG
jgi:proton-coupled amino acid transporter